MKAVDKIKAILNEMQGDVAKVDAGQKAAGTRVRASLLEIRNLCNDGRKEVMELKG